MTCGDPPHFANSRDWQAASPVHRSPPTLLDGTVERFEAVWRQTPPPDLEALLPAEGDLRRRVFAELVHVDWEAL